MFKGKLKALLVAMCLAGMVGSVFAELNSRPTDEERVKIFVQLGHSGKINSIAFSPDGRAVVSGSADKTIKLWDFISGRELLTLRGHSDEVNSVAFSPDGRILVSGSDDKFIKLWDVASGRVLRTIRGDGLSVESVAFFPDGRTVVSGGGDGEIKLWDVSSGRELRNLDSHEDFGVTCLAISPDGRTLVVGSGYDVDLLDVATGRKLKRLGEFKFPVSSVAFSPDGRTVASSSEFETIKLWEVSNGRELHTLDLSKSHFDSISFSPDGRTLASGSGRTTFWDVASGRELSTLPEGAHVTFSPDGRTVATASGLWDVASGKKIRSLGGLGALDEFGLTIISPDGRIFASTHGADTLELRDAYSGQVLHKLGKGSEFVFSPDGRHILSTIRDDGWIREIKMWDVATGQELLALGGFADDVDLVAFSPNGRTIVSGTDSGLIQLWDVASGRELQILSEHNSYVKSIAFSPDGKTFAMGKPDHTVKLLDITSGKPLSILGKRSTYAGAITSVAFSTDGRTLVSNNGGQSCHLWEVSTGKLLHTLSGHHGKVNIAIFSPDGRTVVSGSADHTLKLWDVASGRVLNTLNGHEGEVTTISFSADGKYLFSGSYNGTLSDSTHRKWDVATGKEIAQYISFGKNEWITLTPEGYYTASEKGGDWLNVRLGNKVQGINQFYDVFYRPDIVEAKLRGEDISSMINLTIDDAMKTPPPEVAFTTVPSASSASKEKVCYKITSTGGGIGEVRLFQNGKLVKSDGFYREAVAKREDKMMLASANGEGVYRSMRSLKMVKGESTIQIAKSKGDVVEECQEIDAIPGENELGVVAFNAPNTVQSSMGQASFNSSRPAQAPHLYILSIGINQFADASNNLHYAAKDALDFQKLMQEKSGTLFAPENIHVTSLTDQQASKQGILGKLDELSGQIKPWDSFVLFVASHGVLLGTQYYLVSANFDGTGSMDQLIGSNEIVELSKKVRALNQLFIFDTCHAGGVDNIVGGLYDARMSVLAKKMGLHIYASAGGLQEALDGYQGNGLFTHALLNSMNASGTTDSNADKQVSVMELGARAKQETTTISTKLGSPQSPNIINFGKDNALFGVK